jgi:hypothetical protein
MSEILKSSSEEDGPMIVIPYEESIDAVPVDEKPIKQLSYEGEPTILADYDKLSEPLSLDDVQFRVQSINRGGYVTVLVYKNARIDMQRLDYACGVMGWERFHSRENRNCTVSIFDAKSNHWVSKEDTGTESNSQAEKGLASDSFKRACTNWGIGRELYSYPDMIFQLKGAEKGGENSPYNCEYWLDEKSKDKWGKSKVKEGYDLKLKEWKWYGEFDSKKRLTFLACQDTTGKTRWRWGTMKPKEEEGAQ